jgi:hypothetical protein
MRVGAIKYFGAHQAEPTAASLQELERCNVYVCFFGHCFGTLSPDGKRSITQREYERARELQVQRRMELLPYLVDESPKVRESDELFNKQCRRGRESMRLVVTPSNDDDNGVGMSVL